MLAARHWLAALFLVPLLAGLGLAQQITENPKTPPSRNAGRVLPLKEIARITDEKGKFFFVQPFNVIAGPDGSVYVQEYNQLLKFDPRGRFAMNLVKRGQGPGELDDNLTDFVVREEDIILWSSNNYKLIRLDLDGRLIEDRRLNQGFLSTLLGARGDRYFFLRLERDVDKPRARASGMIEDTYRLVVVPEDGPAVPTPYMISCTSAVQLRPGSISVMSISRAVPLSVDDRTVFFFHSPDYLIKCLDLETGEIVRAFRRPYDRVRYDHRAPAGYPQELVPTYHNDLCRLIWRNGKLWAVTSTLDPKKGLLVDVFSREGRYLDNFYLPLFKIRRNNPQYYAPMAIHGDLLYLLEADEDDLISLVIYEIGED
ncbi:MAG TPA: 6-bladed beta-propeller [Acidobacteriota bacterium]|nr:6-bladed beta-propeller [Acidobacteriota bacterium]